MIFACHNLKRMARWSWKISTKSIIKRMISTFFRTYEANEKWYPVWSTTLSTIWIAIHECIAILFTLDFISCLLAFCNLLYFFFHNYIFFFEIFQFIYFPHKFYDNICWCYCTLIKPISSYGELSHNLGTWATELLSQPW